MRKISIVFLFLVAFALVACNKDEAPQQQAAEEAAKVLPVPANPTDTPAWKEYLKGVVIANMDGVKTTRPFMYFVPGGEGEELDAERANQLDNVQTVIARGVLPGNMMAFGGPDGTLTAQLVVDAFADASPGALKDVRVVYIGTADQFDRVKEAVGASGAELRLVEMK